MPLVFVTDAPTLWQNVTYADVVGVQYEFPVLYRDRVAEGDRFLYYRGSRGAASGSGYFGDGIVGQIIDSGRPGHLIAALHDVTLFDQSIPIRDTDGNYYETGSTKGTNWANGVRKVSNGQFATIIAAANGANPNVRIGPGFADPAHASVMERYSVEVVLALLRSEFGSSSVHEMPANNPGFDIEVRRPEVDIHVEVKGTVLPTAAFHLSEGQRSYGVARAENWRLYVVYNIDTRARSHRLMTCNGGQLSALAHLSPANWNGTLTNDSAQ